MEAGTQDHPFKEERVAAGFTQAGIAKVLGITPSAVSQWETGETVPQRPTRILLSQILSVPIDQVDRWFERPAKEAAA